MRSLKDYLDFSILEGLQPVDQVSYKQTQITSSASVVKLQDHRKIVIQIISPTVWIIKPEFAKSFCLSFCLT